MYRRVSWSFAYITDRQTGQTRGGGDGHAGGHCPYSVELPLSETRRLGFLPSVRGPLVANETRVCSRLKVDTAMFGREMGRKRRWAHSQVTARDGRQGKARGGHQLEMQPKYERCVADAASSSGRPPPAVPGRPGTGWGRAQFCFGCSACRFKALF